MALPKKGLRKITVESTQYAWSIKPIDEGISLSIIPLQNHKQLLSSFFPYEYEMGAECIYSPEEAIPSYIKRDFIIKPHLVRRVIEYALKKGWKPTEEGVRFTWR